MSITLKMHNKGWIIEIKDEKWYMNEEDFKTALPKILDLKKKHVKDCEEKTGYL